MTKNDSRVTRVGRFIRKTSLDELPQLFNVVFKGNLSLVGPRPHAVQGKLQSRLFDEAVDGYFARHRVKPGITGWAQINGWRGEVDSEEKIQKRVEFDLYYIENWSVLFDLYILHQDAAGADDQERERLLSERHCEPPGRRMRADDKLRNPSYRARKLDCFVASLLAMTASSGCVVLRECVSIEWRMRRQPGIPCRP